MATTCDKRWQNWSVLGCSSDHMAKESFLMSF
uniref:Uncharacterized protein n=1 Tax=Arundo donax TaxID=35708 RepID=A0A0A9BT75_ARUDO